MITSMPAPLSSAAGLDSLAPVDKRCRSPHEARAATIHPIRPPASLWLADADTQVNQVLNAYRRTGGLASGDELTFLLRRHTSQPISMLARWIAERRVVSLGWRGEYLLPMFQFDRSNMGVRRSVSAVLGEFDGTFDDWELASWFALPNTWLGDEAPVDVLPRDPNAVLQAARGDRFVARG